MRLAAEELTIRVGPEVVYLRPTLRAALRLERKHGGFDRLFRLVADGHLGAIADVIAESSDRRSDIPRLLNDLAAGGIKAALDGLTVPILAHVMALAGIDPESKPEDAAAAETVTFAEHHARLFRIATGWLGWTPAEAWNATAAEIVEAYRGRMELLTAIFGGKSETVADTVPDASLDTKLKAAMGSIGTKRVQRTAPVRRAA